jgi:hypothetical protein
VQGVVDLAGRDLGNRQAEARVAQTRAGRAQQARLFAEDRQALQEASVEAGGDAAIGGGPPRSGRGHDVLEGDDAVTANVADELLVAVAGPILGEGGVGLQGGGAHRCLSQFHPRTSPHFFSSPQKRRVAGRHSAGKSVASNSAPKPTRSAERCT